MFAIRESQDAPKPHLHSTWNPKKGLDCGHRDELPKKGLELWPLDVPKKRIENERVARAAYNQPFVFCYISIPKRKPAVASHRHAREQTLANSESTCTNDLLHLVPLFQHAASPGTLLSAMRSPGAKGSILPIQLYISESIFPV
jgi:hypothetical protein